MLVRSYIPGIAFEAHDKSDGCFICAVCCGGACGLASRPPRCQRRLVVTLFFRSRVLIIIVIFFCLVSSINIQGAGRCTAKGFRVPSWKWTGCRGGQHQIPVDPITIYGEALLTIREEAQHYIRGDPEPYLARP